MVEPRAESLRSVKSNDSFEKANFLHRSHKSAALSPLAAISTSTPVSGGASVERSQEEVIQSSSEGLPDPQPQVVDSDPKDHSCVPTEDVPTPLELRKKGKPRLRQLEIVQGVTEKVRNSPLSSFILDSNILDVST